MLDRTDSATAEWDRGEEIPVAQAAVLDVVGTGGVQLTDVKASSATSLPTEPRATTADSGAARTVRLRAVEEVWIQADADGARVASDLLPAGTQRTFTARTSLSLRIGDAGAVEYTVNGVPGAPLGPRGAVRDLHLSPQPPQ